MTFVEVEKLLKKEGWYYYKTIGLHIQYKHKNKKGNITIPKHRREAKEITLNTILKQAEVKKCN